VTDTRKDLEGKMFFALKGPNFDGNQYAQYAIESGASYAIVDDSDMVKEEKIILVDDVLKTMQDLGLYHKKKLGIPVIGITGTNGKTTNKELLSRILSKKYKCYATKGNLNNQIGVPLSLLEIASDDEIAVIEMGANKMGDIKELSALADPDYGYITNIGIAHLEGFKSKDNIKIEKGELFRYVKRKKGIFFLNSSEPEVKEIAEAYEHTLSVGEGESDDYRFEMISSIPKVQLKFQGALLESHLYGDHNYENVKMAIAIASYFKVPIDAIREALDEYKPKNNRSQLIAKDGLLLFLDAYNANPSSMQSSVESFANFNAKNKILILGDMLELGDDSRMHHRELLEKINIYAWSDVILLGGLFGEFASLYPAYHFFKDRNEADLYLNQDFSEGTYFLVKGSRGIALEKLKLIQQLQ
jgi:UDP-N-acetylmuramoyl-tripeptide--D-alanyl-D-alanine ligase